MIQKKSNKFRNVILIISILVNVLLGILFCFSSLEKFTSSREYYLDQKSPDYKEIFRNDNYRKIFIEKNDSVYRDYFNKFFVNDPGQAFLLACTFNMIKGGKEYERDIESVLLELKGMYLEAPSIRLHKGKSNG